MSSDSVNNAKINRRDLFLGALFLVGGGLALSRFGRPSRGTDPRRAALALDPEQFALLEQVTEAMIPATDTPGAIGAGVPEFIRDLLDEWANEQTRTQIAAVLESIEKRAWAKYGAAFLELAADRKLELMRAYDAESLAKHDAAYGRFKYLVLVGFYHSEVGATQELRFELVPGAWRACVPFSEIGRASAV